MYVKNLANGGRRLDVLPSGNTKATLDRPWPFREIQRIDKQIKTIVEDSMKNAKKIGRPQSEIYVDESQLQTFKFLLSKRSEVTRQVLIRKN